MITEHEPFRHAFVSNPDVAEAILESAIELAWIMSTLLPPSSAYKPTVYYPEWQELVTTSGSTVNPETDTETDYKLIYCRPVLFFGAEGTVGKPGAVKCLPVEPILLQTTEDKTDNGEQPLPFQFDTNNENRLEESSGLHKLAETSHRESTVIKAKAEGRILSGKYDKETTSPSEATKSSSHVSTTNEKNDTSKLTSSLDDESGDGANCNLQATCKSTTEEVGLESESRAMKLVSDAKEHAANPMEDSETPSYMKENETIQAHQLLSSAQNSDPIQFSKDKILSSTCKPNNSGTASPTADSDQQYKVAQNSQKLLPANQNNSGGSQENLNTTRQLSDAISAAESDIADSKSTATNAADKMIAQVNPCSAISE